MLVTPYCVLASRACREMNSKELRRVTSIYGPAPWIA
jgi:hypothetical protein